MRAHACKKTTPTDFLPSNRWLSAGQAVYEALCGKDRVWIGDFNASANIFTPRLLQQDDYGALISLQSVERAHIDRPCPAAYTMRAELIGHFEPCMTDIYQHIDARMADYIRTHP